MDKTVEAKMKFQYFLDHLTLEEKQAFWRLLHTPQIAKMAEKALISR